MTQPQVPPAVVEIRVATANDVDVLMQMIRELAAYEKAAHAVIAVEEDLLRHGFGPDRAFEALIATVDDRAPGSRCFFAAFRRGKVGPASISKTFLSASGRAASASASV